jgi:hypothetical protein
MLNYLKRIKKKKIHTKTQLKNKTKMKKELVVSELNSVITKLEDAKKQMLDIQNGISFVDGNKEIEKYMSVFDAIAHTKEEVSLCKQLLSESINTLTK